ncbi:MAG: SDR family oxidoreductase [Balneolaceae bacterium]
MKKILITGASRGIGFETAKTLALSGNEVYAVARSKEKLAHLANQHELINPIESDLSTDDGVSAILKGIEGVESFDALINNAGTLINKPFMETSIEEWRYQVEVNLFAAVRLIKTLKPKLAAGSHIVNIGSMGGFQGSDKFNGLSAYSSSKGALSILTECLSTEFSSENIAVNCLCLGAVQTEMLNNAFPGYKAPVNPEEMGKYISDFTLNAHHYMNGRVLPIALNNPS